MSPILTGTATVTDLAVVAVAADVSHYVRGHLLHAVHTVNVNNYPELNYAIKSLTGVEVGQSGDTEVKDIII